MDEHQQLLRVHSNDLHEHLVEEVGNCFESQTFSDLRIRFKGGKTVKAHKLVLAAVSPFLKSVSTAFRAFAFLHKFSTFLELFGTV